jgi:hypothetical protein
MNVSPPYFHVGYVVPRLEDAMDEFTNTLGLRWEEPREHASGAQHWRLAYSLEGPPFVELIEGTPGTPWYATAPRLHHLGRFTYDLDEEIERFTAARARIEVDGREISGRWAYFALASSGVLVEVIEASDVVRHSRFRMPKS